MSVPFGQFITTQTSALWAEATFSGLRLPRQEAQEHLTKRHGVKAASKAVAGLEGADGGAQHEQALGRRLPALVGGGTGHRPRITAAAGCGWRGRSAAQRGR